MGVVSVTTFSSDTETVTRTKLNGLAANLVTEFNGNIDNDNIKAAAGIDVSKLDFATMDADIAATRANSTTTALSLTCNSLTTGKCLDIVATTAITTGNLARFYSNGAETDARNLVFIVNDNSAAVGAIPLALQNDSTGNCLFIDQNGDGVSINIDSEATSSTLLNMASINTSGNVIALTNTGVQATGNLVAFTQDADTSAADLMILDNDGTGQCLVVQQDGVLASSKYALHVNSTAAQTNSGLVFINQDNGSSDQIVTRIRNDGTGICLNVDQNGNANAIQIDNSGTSSGIIVNQTGALSVSTGGVRIYTTQAQTAGSLLAVVNNTSTGTESQTMVDFTQDYASASGIVCQIKNDGAGTGLFIDQNGNSAALQIDTEVANDGIALNIDVAGSSPQPFSIYRNDDVTGNVVMRLGSGYIWVDTNGDLRISATQPTSDTGGTIVGTQS